MKNSSPVTIHRAFFFLTGNSLLYEKDTCAYLVAGNPPYPGL
jgi:hypothetical protein